MKIFINGLVVTMDPQRRVIADGAVAVAGALIQAVGRSEELCAAWPDAERIDVRDHLVLPGFINAHTHLFQVLIRGIGVDMPLAEWLAKAVWPLTRQLGPQECYLGTLLASAEMLGCGVTTFVDSHYINKEKSSYDAIAQAVEEIGIRGVITRSTVDSDPAPADFREAVDVAVKESVRIIDGYHKKCGGRIRVRVEPLNEALASEKMVLAMREVSRSYGVGFSMHLAETHERVEGCRKKHGYSSLEWLWQLGVLGPDALLAHCVWVSHQEIALLQSTGTKVAHNPVANQYLADGVAPVREMLDRGVTVAVATDGAASNNGQNIFEAMKAAVLLQKVSRLDAGALTAQKALEMVTIDAARAIGMEEEIGSIEAGKRADLVFIDLETTPFVPRVSALSNLVYVAPAGAVDRVVVDGQTVFSDGHPEKVDAVEVVRKCNKAVERMIRDAGIAG